MSAEEYTISSTAITITKDVNPGNTEALTCTYDITASTGGAAITSFDGSDANNVQWTVESATTALADPFTDYLIDITCVNGGG